MEQELFTSGFDAGASRYEAELRQKDDGGQQPAGWALRPEMTLRKAFSVWPYPMAKISNWNIPLYTKPANVAALEARVKELEGVLSHLLETEEVIDPPTKPRILDLAYTAFMSGACGKNLDDGGKASNTGTASLRFVWHPHGLE